MISQNKSIVYTFTRDSALLSQSWKYLRCGKANLVSKSVITSTAACLFNIYIVEVFHSDDMAGYKSYSKDETQY